MVLGTGVAVQPPQEARLPLAVDESEEGAHAASAAAEGIRAPPAVPVMAAVEPGAARPAEWAEEKPSLGVTEVRGSRTRAAWPACRIAIARVRDLQPLF